MRELRWNEALSPRVPPPLVEPDVPREPRGLLRLVWWEDLLTLALIGIVFLAVIGSIDSATWVDGMPSLYPIAALGLIMGMLAARIRWPEGYIHLIVTPIGVAAILAQILAILPGAWPVQRFEELVTRMRLWFDAAFGGGISDDDLPFAVMVVTLSWLAAYMSSWAIFRWQNAWLGLIPGGIALLINISYLPGQFSFTFVIYLFGGALLVTRMYLMERAKAWREGSMPYPPTLSLSVLHATFWLTLVLVALAWMLPQANETSALESLWKQATAPVTDRVEGLSRVFISVHAKKPVRVHSFDSTLPFQGSITLPETQVLEVEGEPGLLPFLRADSYEQYSSQGWKQQSRGSAFLGPDEALALSEALRELSTVQVESQGRTGDAILSHGQPVSVDRDAIARIGGDINNVTGLESDSRVERGETYEVTGSVSVAPEDALRAAGTDYPQWVREQYLPLPGNVPARVHELATSLTTTQPTPYDQATAIQNYLRAFYPYDLDVPKTPVGEDAVDFFLFESRRGYFDHHASAMVVLLRSAGIPARLAVGYALRPQDRDLNGVYDVTEQSAYAWPEVYFPGLGFVEFNPTPDLPAITRPGAPVSEIAPQGFQPEDAPQNPPVPAFPEEGAGAAQEEVSSASNSGLWIALGAVGGFFAIVLATGGGLRFAWTRGMGGLDLPAQLWEKTVRLASWGRVPPGPTQTPKEYAQTLQDEVAGLEGIDLLTETYVEHRFGGRALDEESSARLQSAWQSVRGRLLRRLLRRK